jgi:hypothetical protein
MKEAPLIPDQRLSELRSMADGLYLTITGLTDTPIEAVTIITILHLRLWINCRDSDSDTKGMLEGYAENFLENFEANEALYKKELN